MSAVSSSSSYCPSDVFTGIVTLSGPISPDSLTSITTNESPLTLSFASRVTSPTLVGNIIEDSLGNSIIYNGIRYEMANIMQICAPLHNGYPTPSTSRPVAEIVISFFNNTISGSYSSGILLCIPIYESSVESHSAYINQLIADDIPAASLQTLFFDGKNDKSQTSLGYKTCIETVSNITTGDIRTFNMFVIVFTNGVTLNSTHFQTLATKIAGKSNPLPNFKLPPDLRGGFPTVSAYRYTSSGDKVNTATSATGILYTTQVSSGSSDFSDRFEAFPSPKLSSNKLSSFSDSCPYYKSTQYKCVPFDRLKNMKGDYVIPDGTMLSTILNSQTNKIKGASLSGGSSEINTKTIETVAIVFGSIIATGVIALAIGHLVVKLSED